MKTDNNIIEGFKSVEFMRRVRNQIGKDIQNMNFNEIQNYFQKRRLSHRTTISDKEIILV